MASSCFSHLLGYNFSMRSQHSRRLFSVPLPYNRNANVASKYFVNMNLQYVYLL